MKLTGIIKSGVQVALIMLSVNFRHVNKCRVNFHALNFHYFNPSVRTCPTIEIDVSMLRLSTLKPRHGKPTKEVYQ